MPTRFILLSFCLFFTIVSEAQQYKANYAFTHVEDTITGRTKTDDM